MQIKIIDLLVGDIFQTPDGTTFIAANNERPKISESKFVFPVLAANGLISEKFYPKFHGFPVLLDEHGNIRDYSYSEMSQMTVDLLYSTWPEKKSALLEFEHQMKGRFPWLK